MATTFDLTLSVKNSDISRGEECLSEAHQLIQTIELELSEYLPGSVVHRLNLETCGCKIEMAPQIFDLFRTAIQLEELTDRAFSLTAKSPVPVSGAFALVEETQSVMKLDSRAHTSLGGIGKGYALDQVRLLVNDWGFYDYLLSAGGSSIFISGFASPSLPWSVGWIPDSKATSFGLTYYSGHPIALGISGTSERGEHITDPRTGRPSTKAISAFISHPSATYADALSTALFVLGWDAALTLFNGLETKPGMACMNLNHEFTWNGTFLKEWGSLN